MCRRLRQLEAGECSAEEAGGRARSRDRGDEGSRRKKMVSVPARRQQVAYGRGRGSRCDEPARCSRWRDRRWSIRAGRPRDAPADRADEGTVGAVSAVWLSTHPHFPGPRGHRMSPGRAHRLWQAASCRCRANGRGSVWPLRRGRAPSAKWAEPGLVVRLCVRPLRQWAAAQVPDRRRRVHPGGLGDRCRRPHRSGRVIEVLSRLVSVRGAPRFLRCDNGPEFVSRALLSWFVTQASIRH